MDADFFTRVFQIIVIDLVLSGDNAVVIGMAARSLSSENRRKAIVWGGFGAVGLRILFTAIAAVLLGVPYLQAIGGVLLLWIAYRLIRPHDEGANIRAAGNLREAIQTIVLADVVMSLDNILAVGGAAHGSLGLLLFGLALSIPLLLIGSGLVARILHRFPMLLFVGVFVLVHAAIDMILHDDLVEGFYHPRAWVVLGLSLVISALIVAAIRLIHGRLGGVEVHDDTIEVDPESSRPNTPATT
ncbi:MAG: TerC family protein [Chloroflexota bacterium]|nr:TerC family protein [Chloroflexota bacterium]